MKTHYQKAILTLAIAALYASPSYSQTRTSFGGLRYSVPANTAGTGGDASNAYFGHQAGLANTGTDNTFVGSLSGVTNTTGNKNAFLGAQSGYNATGDNNAFLGYRSGFNTSTGANNLFLGTQSGNNNQVGSGNIFLGYQAGFSETGSVRLYIDNSNTATPLIWGNFSANQLQFNGDVVITGIPTAPTAAAGTSTTQLATTAFVTTANNLKANIASPALTGVPTAPTAAPGANTTQLATTAFVTTAGNLKANLVSPALTGIPAAPTAAAGTNTTQLATTAFVTTANNLKANLASPALTGVPTAPTATAGTNTTQLATTAFVTAADNLKANLASPALTGVPTAPTAAAGTNTTQLATTAFVTAANTAGHTFPSFPANAGDGGGSTNAYFGHEAGLVNTGASNTFTGYRSGYSNTTGSWNTASGYRALQNNTTANLNTAIGRDALYTQSFSNGGVAWDIHNVAVGFGALYSNQPTASDNGHRNTAIGDGALRNNTTGHSNTANGYDALYSSTTGERNTASGRAALYYNTTGSFNTALGQNSGPASGNGLFSNSTVIGYNVVMTASNQVRIGSGVTSIGGPVAWSIVSDGRFKKNLQEDVPGLAFIQQLRPVSYEMDRPKLNKFLRGEAGEAKRGSLGAEAQALDLAAIGSAGSSAGSSATGPTEAPALPTSADEAETKTIPTRNTGFIAQEVEQIVKDNGYVFSGVEAPQNEHDHYSLRYAEFVVPLVKAVQEQQAQIEALQEGKSIATTDSAVSTTLTAQHNTVQGHEALTANTTGQDNTATGAGGLFSNTSGNDNTATGRDALFDNTTGSYNTASGRLALFDNVTGNYNTALGYDAGTQAGDLNNTTAIGHGATTTASNQIRIGNAEVTSIGGYVGWSTLSDTRFKQDIQEDVAGLAFIEQLRPISYITDTAKLKAFLRDEPVQAEGKTEGAEIQTVSTRSIGFAAQEVEQLVKDKGYVFTGVEKPQSEHDHYNLRYAEFVVPLVKATQEQQAMITALQQQNEALQQRLERLESLMQGRQ